MRESTKWLVGNFGVVFHCAAVLLIERVSLCSAIFCLRECRRQDFRGLWKCFFWKHLPLETKTAGSPRPLAGTARSLAVGHAAHRLCIRPIVDHEAVAVGHLHL